MINYNTCRFVVMVLLVCIVNGANAWAQGNGQEALAKEIKELKENITGLKKELAGFKSQAETLSKNVSNINAVANTLTNDLRIARPNRIPEDIRFLSDFMNHEKVKVHNGRVYTIKRPLINALGTLTMIDPLASTQTNPVTIDKKLIELRLASQSGLDTNELATICPQDHVKALYEKNKIEDWQFHRLRYGISTFYNDKIDGIGAGIALRGYPAYSRYIDGRFLDFDNGIWRRLSFQVSIGGMLTRDDAKADSTGLVGTVGVGWDIVHGISLFAGRSFYAYSKPGEDGTTTDDATVYGITLNAEFWQTLFGHK